MPANQVPMILWIKEPQPKLDDDRKPVVNEDNSYTIESWLYRPVQILAPAHQTHAWVERIRQGGCAIVHPDGRTVENIPPDWIKTITYVLKDTTPSPDLQTVAARMQS